MGYGLLSLDLRSEHHDCLGFMGLLRQWYIEQSVGRNENMWEGESHVGSGEFQNYSPNVGLFAQGLDYSLET